jgi:hypothetical protein
MHIAEKVVQLCPYFSELQPIMSERHTTNPLVLFGAADDAQNDSSSVSVDEE